MSISQTRCGWVGEGKPFYEAYHDKEWGVPVHDERMLFEMLILEGAQAGLSWETILKRREAYRQVFLNFEPAAVARMSDSELEKALLNPGIIRNRLKVFGARQNARSFIKIQETFGSFDAYVWRFVEGVPKVNKRTSLAEIPPQTSESDALSKDLKNRGMTFVGSVIMYAYMQAIGMVNDHTVDCFRYKEITSN